MKRAHFVAIGVGLLLLLSGGFLLWNKSQWPQGGLREEKTTLSKEAKVALDTAIADEYHARAVYQAVIEKFGEKKPFSNIIRSEEKHIGSLAQIYTRYGFAAPADPWAGKVTAPESFSDACAIGVSAEIANAKMYREDLMPKVQEYPDIVAEFTHLLDASEHNHLAAFSKCQ